MLMCEGNFKNKGMCLPMSSLQLFIPNSIPVSSANISQDPYLMPETTASTETYLCNVFAEAYRSIIKMN